MIPSRLLELDSALDSFLERFFPAFVTRQTFQHLHAYARGLLSDLPRKSVEPIALQSGIPVRTLQEFLRDHVWDFSLARNLLQQQVAQQLTQMPNDGLGTVGLIDETSVLKKGKMTPGVQRQYLGCVGKVDNGIVTVHLGVSRQRYKTLIDADLFLPESWSDDRPRCRLAGIPDELTHRTKWQIAREQLLRAQANGVILDWLTFDEGYGSSPAFLLDLSQRQQSFVGEVPRSLRCLAAAKHGKKPEERIPAKTAQEVVRNATAFVAQPWQVVRLSRETMQDQIWRVKVAQVWLSSVAGWSPGTYQLMWASNDETGEEKYFVCDAAPGTEVEVMVRVGFRRWSVEHLFRICKSEIGFTNFEGRNYRALMRHMTVCLVCLAFASEQTEQLRGEKSGDHVGAGVPGCEIWDPEVVGATPPTQRLGESAKRVGVSPKTKPGSPRVQEKAGRESARSQKAKPSKEASQSANANGSIQVAL